MPSVDSSSYKMRRRRYDAVAWEEACRFQGTDVFSSVSFLRNSPRLVGCIALGVEFCCFRRLVDDYGGDRDPHCVTFPIVTILS